MERAATAPALAVRPVRFRLKPPVLLLSTLFLWFLRQVDFTFVSICRDSEIKRKFSKADRWRIATIRLRNGKCGSLPPIFFYGFNKTALKTLREGVMKCSNPDCSRGIGLVSHRRAWFDEQRYCSKRCCEAVTSELAQRRSSHQRRTTSYFDWLMSQPTRRPQPRPGQPGVRVSAVFG
jgi:hypothetical protein